MNTLKPNTMTFCLSEVEMAINIESALIDPIVGIKAFMSLTDSVWRAHIVPDCRITGGQLVPSPASMETC